MSGPTHEWTVAGAVLEHDDGLLLVCNQRRNGSLDWSTPGGVIDATDANVLAGLTREVEEETGLVVREWEGPLYEVTAVAVDLGWVMHCEVHRAVAFEGELRVEDPDGIVVDAAFVPATESARGSTTASTGCASRSPSGWPSGGSRPQRRGFHYDVRGTDRSTRFEVDPLPVGRRTRERRARRAVDPPSRSRRVLRVGRAARGSGAARSAGRGRRARQPRRRRRRELRGAARSASTRRCPWRAPGERARTRCSSRPRFDAYSDASEQVMAILRDVTPLVEPISLDEAFLDVAGARPVARHRPRDRCAAARGASGTRPGLTASVGAATTKLLAKLASDLAKPDGLLVVEPGTELEFLHPLPVSRLWGVGPATRRRLDAFGVRHRRRPRAAARADARRARSGASAGSHLHALAWNRDDRAVEPDRVTKSIGHEETFAQDRTDRDGLERDALRMADAVATRLRSSSKTARTVQLKVRYARLPDDHPVAHAADADRSRRRDRRHRAHVCSARSSSSDGIRLLGVSVQQLDDGVAVQGRLELDDGAVVAVGRPASARGRGRLGARAVRRRRGRLGGVPGPGQTAHGSAGQPWGPEDGPDPRPDARRRRA